MIDFINFAENTQPVFFKRYLGQEEIIDEDGNITGSYIPIYGPLQSALLCVSPNKGTSEVDQFGTFADYDRTMVTADTKCPIDENTVLWIDGADTDGPYNAIVKQKAPWKNSISYAIKNVNVSMYKEQQDKIEQARNMKTQYQNKVTDDAENDKV